MTDERFYLDTFHTTVPNMEKVVATALSNGGSYCDLYFENTIYSNLLLKDSEVTSGGFHIDYGVGIRVLDGEKTGYAYSESTDLGSMLEAAKAASAISLASLNGKNACISMPKHSFVLPSKAYYQAQIAWSSIKASSLIPSLKKIETSIKAKDTSVEKVLAKISYSECDIMMFNSLGELRCDTRPMGSITVSVVFTRNGKNENKTVSRSFRKGAEMIDDSIIEEIAKEAVTGIDARFEAIRPKGGSMPVVMGAGASGILLHEAMGHAFEGDFIRKGQSIFEGKLNTQICSSKISIIDDGTLQDNRGACCFDDEGVPSQKTYMVKDGILTSYLHDRISAAQQGVAPTGNGRRESFRYNPIPRMRCTYMESGDCNPEDIVSEVKNGIYVDEFSNGQVKIGERDFTFYVKSGYLIENGKLTAPIKDINIIGNGPQALSDITAVGNDLRIDNGTWTCGKEQSVPVSCGIPTVLIKSLTVGGEQ